MILFNYAQSVQPPKATTPETKFITEEQFYRLFHIFKNTDYFIPVLLAGTTGMREGEICGLQDYNIHLDRNEIYVKDNLVYIEKKWTLDSTKTHRSTRPVYIFPDVSRILKQYLIQRKEQQLKYGPQYIDSGFFCRRPDGRFINPVTLGKRFTIIARKYNYHISFHGLRHTHVTILFNKGKDLKTVADKLGHSTTKITTDTYIHSSIESQKRLLGDIKLPGLGTF
ncbi:site-specific integrase [Vallitalea guaymasensis]|uniref:Site-specific integrase n=1 Tax=Vallitalea guaymasensis TaxID=1185412 RepID=A0A8J8SC98_9FIRM|nr:site-specific integrase [Vallitalea guaymasensis]QUH29603.1 site-specific integrase [Vallitalea guaymasensis]